MPVSVGCDLDRRLLTFGRGAEIGAGDEAAVPPQVGRRCLVGDGAVLEDVGTVGNLQGGLNELLHEQHGDSLVTEDVDHLEQLLHDGRREALRHLIEH